MSDRIQSMILCVALAVAVVALFSLGVAPTHLRLDDWGYTLGCPFVKDGLAWKNIARAFCDFGHGGIWMPLTYMSYMADISLFGGGWRVHHAVNVALHAVNALLVYRLLLSPYGENTSMGSDPMDEGEGNGRMPVAAIAAAVWALHPLRAEAVVWVASRKEELWTLFGLAGILTWLGFCRKGGWMRWTATLAFFMLSCLSKPTAVCLPVLLFFIGLWRRVPRKGRMLLALSPLFAVSLFVGVIAMYSQTHPTGMERVPIADTTFAWRALNAAVSLGLYVWHAIVPVGLRIDYRAVPGLWPLDGALGLFVLGCASVVMLAVFLFSRRSVRIACFQGLVWALVTLLPVLGLLGLTGDKAYADRYTYMPAVGLSMALAIVMARIPSRRILLVVSSAMLVSEAVLAVPVIRGYRDDRAAYERVLADDPNHWRALRTLGSDYCALQGRMDEGVAMLRRSLVLRPSKLTADSLAYVLACRGKKGDAAEVLLLGRAVAADPQRDPGGMMLDALGKVAYDAGDATNAVKWLSAALVAPARSHGNVHSMLTLGLALAQCGRRDEALEVLRRLDRASNADVRRRAREALRKLCGE